MKLYVIQFSKILEPKQIIYKTIVMADTEPNACNIFFENTSTLYNIVKITQIPSKIFHIR